MFWCLGGEIGGIGKRTMNEKDLRLAEFCRARKLEGVILRRRSNVAWITDGADFHVDSASNLGAGVVVWTPQKKLVYTDNIEAPRFRAEELRGAWEVRESPWWEAGPALPDGAYLCDFPDDSPFYELRASLTDGEIERVRALGRDTAEVVERLMKNDAKPGMTEWHLGGAVAGWLRDRGIFAHVVLVAADERIAKFRHPIPTKKPIEKLAMVAVCAQRGGLIISATRLVHFGPLSDDLRRRHAAVCRVDRVLHDATRPGARWCDVLAAGQRAYAEAGYPDEWKLHHQGGPMGYECRDFKATPTETRPVLTRQLVGWNPTVTGTKSEDTVLTASDEGSACEVVTRTGHWPCGETGRPEILVR